MEQLIGLACPFGVVSRLFPGPPGKGFRRLYEPGAFDEAIADVRAGRSEVGLWIDHREGSELCSTRDGTLQLGLSASGLCFTVDPTSPSGAAALTAARRIGRPACSVGTGVDELAGDEAHETQSDGTVLIRKRRVRLFEISLCDFASFEQTFTLYAPYESQPTG